MEKQLRKCVVGYFLYLSKMDTRWKELEMAGERPLTCLKNQVEQLRLVSDDSLDKADICEIPGLRAKLVFKINVAIEDEIALLSDIASQLNNANQELRHKLKRLEAARSKVDHDDADFHELVLGSPHRPRLDLLMEWAIDSCNYYNDLYTSINVLMRSLDCKDEETVENLRKSFTQNKIKRANLDRILGFTQFVAKEIC